MQFKTSSLLLWVAVIVVAGFAVYKWVIQPRMQRQVMEQAIEKGCEDVVKRFDEQKEEIVEDLAKLLEKMDGIDEEETELRKELGAEEGK